MRLTSQALSPPLRFRFAERRCGELHREPVKQFGMTGPFALRAEVVHRFDEADSEQHLPAPVDRHPGRERMPRADQPPGESETIIGRPLRQRGETLRDRRRHLFARFGVFPADQDERLAEARHFLHDHRRRERIDQPLPLALEPGQIRKPLPQGVRRTAFEEASADLCPLRRAGTVSRIVHQFANRLGDRGNLYFGIGQNPVVYPHVVNEAVKPPLRPVPPSNPQRFLRGERLIEQIEQNPFRFGVTIHIKRDAGRLPRAVAGHKHMMPGVRRQAVFGFDPERIIEPAFDEIQLQPPLVENQRVAVTLRDVRHPGKNRPPV